MKKFLSLVLALVMALSLTTVAWGAYTDLASVSTGSTSCAGSTRTAYVLDDDLTLSGPVSLGATPIYVGAGKDVTITAAAPVVITANIEDAFHVASGGKLTLGENITVTSTIGGILYAEGGTIIVNGTLTATNTDNMATAFAKGGAIEVNGTITSTQQGGYNVTAKNGATVTINGTVISSAGSAAQANGGNVIINNGAVVSTTEAVQGKTAVYAANGGVVTVNGGDISSAKGYTLCAVSNGTINVAGGTVSNGAIAYEGTGATVNISNGTVNGPLYAEEGKGTIAITGGTFSSDVRTYLAAGLEQTADGVVVSEGGAVLGTKYDMVTTDVAQTKTVGVTVNTYAAKAPKDTNKDGLLDQAGNVKYVEFSNMPGVAFVQVNTVGEADYTVYQTGTKTVFGYFAAVASPKYLGNGAPFTAFGDNCLEFDIDPVPGAKYYFFQGVVYKADPSFTSTTNLMVGSTLTPVVAESVANWVQHTPAYTYDKDYKVVGVKCAECGTPAALYANFASVPKAAQGVALALGDGQWYVWAAGPVADTDTKVQSAATFDAGIAMYIGMSVLAATGSAVVIGKKKD